MSLYDPDYVNSICNYTTNGFPKIIHQIWISENGKNMPKNWEKSPIEWKKYHSDYIYILWDLNTALDFIEKYFPNYLQIYKNFKYVVSRCDMLRICIIYKYGGIYSDLDNYPLKNIEEYINIPNIDTYYPELKVSSKILINNNLIFSKRNSELFIKMLEHIENKSKSKSYYINKYMEIREYNCIDIVTHFYKNKEYNIHILPYEKFNPYNLGENITLVKKSDIVIMQTQGGSWYDEETKTAIFVLGNWISFIILLLLFLILVIIIIMLFQYPGNSIFNQNNILIYYRIYLTY